MKMLVVLCAIMLSGCAHYKSTIINVRTPGDVTFGDVRNENLSENVSPTLRAQVAENAKLK